MSDLATLEDLLALREAALEEARRTVSVSEARAHELETELKAIARRLQRVGEDAEASRSRLTAAIEQGVGGVDLGALSERRAALLDELGVLGARHQELAEQLTTERVRTGQARADVAARAAERDAMAEQIAALRQAAQRAAQRRADADTDTLAAHRGAADATDADPQ